MVIVFVNKMKYKNYVNGNVNGVNQIEIFMMLLKIFGDNIHPHHLDLNPQKTNSPDPQPN